MRFVDLHRDRYGVEPICRVLTEHGLPIAPSTYYAARVREPSRRARRDAVLAEHVLRVHRSGARRPGARAVWRQLAGEGIVVGRSTVERLMRQLALTGTPSGRPRARRGAR